MPLYKRHCGQCDRTEEDLYEPITAEMTIPCPACGVTSYTKVHQVPHIEADGKYSFFNGLDKVRQKAADGHGTASYRA